MVNVFPQLSNIDTTTYKTIIGRAGNNVSVSKLKPWMRLLSAVDGGLVIESIPKNDSFSQRYGNSKRSGRVGIDFNGKDVLEEYSVRGFRPSPTISDVSINNGAQGLSRKTTFSITCYTIGQVETVTKHFLEPGFTVLLEYGWNTSNSYLQKCGLDTCSIASYNNIKTIIKKRKESEGTYDAVLGYITGGGIEYGDGETFNVNVEVTSLGEIPSYLQPQRGIVKTNKPGDNTVKSGKKFASWKIHHSRTGNQTKKDIGKALFMQMYNSLPASKQILDIKNLVDNSYWTDTANFINMDERLRDILRDDLDEGEARVKKDGKETTAKIPEGVNLITDQRFIRLELAFKIINTVASIELQPVVTSGKCGGTVQMNNLIDISTTVCRAHKHMFSTDVTKLYIPNKHLPNFGLDAALTSTDDQPTFLNLDELGQNEVDAHPETTREKRYFPRNTAITIKDLKDVDSSILEEEKQAYEWGLLRDLYINFDFFISVIERKGLLIKDIVLELLNGISSAVNMYWDFQIVERCSGGSYEFKNEGETTVDVPVGIYQLQIRDVSSGGYLGNHEISAVFQSRGLKTPFLNSSLKLDIPGAMKNMIVGQRNAQTQGNVDGKEVFLERDGLFTDMLDPVLEVINNFKKQHEAKKQDDDETKPKTEKEIEEENRKKNLELFTKVAGIVPRIQDIEGNIDAVVNIYDILSDSNATTLNELMIVGTWADSTLLKQVQQIDEGNYDGGSYSGPKRNSVILPIGFNFTLHGVSGLKVGDIFKIEDLPRKYKNKLFQVMRINNTISDDGWVTEVEANIRNTEVL